MSNYLDIKNTLNYERITEYSSEAFSVFNSANVQFKSANGISNYCNRYNGSIELTYNVSSGATITGYSNYLYYRGKFQDSNIIVGLILGHSPYKDDTDILILRKATTPILDVEFKRITDADTTITFEYSPEGHRILVNGEEPEGLFYKKGDPSVPFHMLTYSDYFIMGRWLRGIIKDVKCIDGDTGETSIHYPINANSEYLEETVHNAVGTITPMPIYGCTNYVGYIEFPNIVKWGGEPATVPDHPFKEVDFDLTVAPRDEEIAFLNWKDTGLPAILPDGEWTSHTVDDVVRNEQCWCHSKALTCMSVLADLWGFRTMVTLLSPRHVIIAEHIRGGFNPNSGTPYATGYKNKDLPFMDMDNNIQIVRGIDSQTIGFDYDAGVYIPDEILSDTAILLLSEPITLDVEYAKVLPAEFADNAQCTPPISVAPTKEGTIAVERMAELQTSGIGGFTGYDNMSKNPEYQWSRWPANSSRIGDSSRPTFIYDGDQFFLCSVALTYGKFGFDNGKCITNKYFRGLGTTDAQAKIQKAMNDLDDRNGYTEHCELQVGTIPDWDYTK